MGVFARMLTQLADHLHRSLLDLISSMRLCVLVGRFLRFPGFVLKRLMGTLKTRPLSFMIRESLE